MSPSGRRRPLRSALSRGAASILLLLVAVLCLASSPSFAASADDECSASDGETCGGRGDEGGEGGGDGGDARGLAADADCEDDHEKCGEWSDSGECVKNPKYMLVSCRKACGVCGATEEPVVLEDESLCVDEHEKCSEWKDAGECSANAKYMLISCRNSCGSCPVNVTKDTDFGEAQRVEGEEAEMTAAVVRLSIEYMRPVRTDPQYASIRDGCTNQHKDCALWAAIGECTANPGYMEVSCAPSCQTCELIDIKNRCPMDPDAPDALHPGDLNRMFERITKEGSEEREKYGVTIHSRPADKAEFAKDIESADVKEGPWVITFDDLVTPEECDKIIWYGHEKGYERSQDVGKIRPDGTHDGIVSDSRTSLNAWCNETCANDPVVSKVIDRISEVTGVPRENSEDLQLLEYSVGQYYVQHHDYIEYQRERPCGVRILTFFLYLNDVEAGGGTSFPDLDIVVTPKRGKALLWPSVLDSDPSAKDGRTDHAALKVEEGIKYGANAWIHLRDFQKALKDNCHN